MSNEKITVERALELLDKAVEKKGADYVYDAVDGGCVYAIRDENGERVPSCIVGHVLADEKPETFRKLARVEAEEATSFRIHSSEIADLIRSEIEPDAIEVLRVAQNAQDCAVPWGGAVKVAHQRAAILPERARDLREGDRA